MCQSDASRRTRVVRDMVLGWTKARARVEVQAKKIIISQKVVEHEKTYYTSRFGMICRLHCSNSKKKVQVLCNDEAGSKLDLTGFRVQPSNKVKSGGGQLCNSGFTRAFGNRLCFLATCMSARMRPHWTGGQGFSTIPAGSQLETLELSTCGPLKSDLRS